MKGYNLWKNNVFTINWFFLESTKLTKESPINDSKTALTVSANIESDSEKGERRLSARKKLKLDPLSVYNASKIVKKSAASKPNIDDKAQPMAIVLSDCLNNVSASSVRSSSSSDTKSPELVNISSKNNMAKLRTSDIEGNNSHTNIRQEDRKTKITPIRPFSSKPSLSTSPLVDVIMSKRKIHAKEKITLSELSTALINDKRSRYLTKDANKDGD